MLNGPVLKETQMRSPLNRYNLPEHTQPMNETAGVWANEVPLLGYISLRGNVEQPEFLDAVHGALGAHLPTQPCSTQTLANHVQILWISPDEWLIVCPREQSANLQLLLRLALAKLHSQVVDNSGGFTTVILQGKHATDLLQHCTVYNVHDLPLGQVVGTTFGKMSCFLMRHGEGYKLVFRRSFADYIWTFLVRAAAPYGFGVQSIE